MAQVAAPVCRVDREPAQQHHLRARRVHAPGGDRPPVELQHPHRAQLDALQEGAPDVSPRRVAVELVALVEVDEAGDVGRRGAAHRMRRGAGRHRVVARAEHQLCGAVDPARRQGRDRRHDHVLAPQEHLDSGRDQLAGERGGHGRVADRQGRVPAVDLASLAEHADEATVGEGAREARPPAAEAEPMEEPEEVGVVPDVRAEERAQRGLVGGCQAAQRHRAGHSVCVACGRDRVHSGAG